MKKYITIGTKNISKEVFRKILRPEYYFIKCPDDNYIEHINVYKPNGGLWSSEFVSRIYCISQWHDYLLYEDPETAKYKNIEEAALFTLKEDAKILTIDSTQKIIDTATKYPSYHYMLAHDDIKNKLNIIDYEALSKDYDGVYVSVNQLGFNEIANTFNSWSVDTLLLFNLECIKEYQSVKINVPHFPYEKPPYITEISAPKQVLEYSDYYEEVYNYVRKTFEKLLEEGNYTFIKYLDYYNAVINTTEDCIIIAQEAQIKNLNNINERLKDNGININNKDLIRNIAYNYLSTYLDKNKYREEPFIKSLKKKKAFMRTLEK